MPVGNENCRGPVPLVLTDWRRSSGGEKWQKFLFFFNPRDMHVEGYSTIKFCTCKSAAPRSAPVTVHLILELRVS